MISRHPSRTLFWSILLNLGLLGFVLYLISRKETLPTTLAWVLLFLSIAVHLYKLLERNYLPFYLLVQRIKNRIGNPSANWNLIVRFEGRFVIDSIEIIHSKLLENYQDKIKIKQKLKNFLSLTLENFINFDIILNEPEKESASSISISFMNFRVSYQDSTRIIDNALLPLLGIIDRLVNPERSFYTMNIEFDEKKNPFYGLYVQRFKPEEITSFRVNLLIKDYQEKDIVEISKSSISISAQNDNAFQKLAQEFLSLSPDLKMRFKHG